MESGREAGDVEVVRRGERMIREGMGNGWGWGGGCGEGRMGKSG